MDTATVFLPRKRLHIEGIGIRSWLDLVVRSIERRESVDVVFPHVTATSAIVVVAETRASRHHLVIHRHGDFLAVEGAPARANRELRTILLLVNRAGRSGII